MKVVILCGGYGMRIRDVADDIPKPMIPVGNLPIIWHIMMHYSCHHIKDFVLCLGHKGHAIKNFFVNYDVLANDFTIKLGAKNDFTFHNHQHDLDWKITFAETGLNAMTGARIKRVQKYLEGEDNFMLTYGDGVGDVDLDALLKFHKSHGKIMTVTGVRPPGRFGELVCNAKGEVLEFNEKTQTNSGRISGGFFVCRKEIFDYIDDRENLIFEHEPMNALVGRGQMMVYQHDGFWQPMDTYRDYALLNSMYNEGKAPWVVWK